MIQLWIIDLASSTNIASNFYQNFWNACKISMNRVNLEPIFYISNSKELKLEIEFLQFGCHIHKKFVHLDLEKAIKNINK